jgi:membrane fusion protein, multidrug efflux system
MTRRLTARIFLLSAVALGVVSGCGTKGQEGTPRKNLPAIKGVTLQTIREEGIPDQLEAVGTVRAGNSAVIAARIPGTVTSILVKEGERVSKGQLLLTIEAAESTAGAAGAQAGVEEALRGVEEARTRKSMADATFGRYQKLFQEQAVTRQEFDGREMERDVAAQGLARTEARLAQAREGSKAATAVAGYTRVTAPRAGIVTSKSIDPGMTVFPGMPLLTVEGEGGYRLEVAVPESLLVKVRSGDAVQVAIDGIGSNLSGRVAEVVPTVDPASRTFIVKLETGARGLRSGIFGRALFPVGTRKGLLVPKSAVLERGALTMVWVVGEDNIARMRLVKVGKAAADRVEVLAGLSSGERVIVGGVEKVVDGSRIE